VEQASKRCGVWFYFIEMAPTRRVVGRHSTPAAGGTTRLLVLALSIVMVDIALRGLALLLSLPFLCQRNRRWCLSFRECSGSDQGAARPHAVRARCVGVDDLNRMGVNLLVGPRDD
jgi:hypothetical protein